MQVNKEKFPAVLPHFLELLESCDFYAFDEEMTGINVPEVTESITFAPEDSYESKRLAASRYHMIQVGVCLFHKEDGAGNAAKGGSAVQRYTARPFNFILFPNWTDELAQLRPDDGGTGAVNRDVVLSPSALAFLRRHGMDFQQWVYEGISLCDAPGERMLRRFFDEKHKGEEEGVEGATAAFFTDEEQAWLDKSIAAAEELVARVADADAAGTPASVTREVMLEPQLSRNAREHLRRHAAQHWPTVSVSFRRAAAGGGGGGGGGRPVVTTLSALTAEEAARRAETAAALRERELVDLLGFRLVFNALVASRKPCVGHNCLADILFLMAALDGPLPATLGGWKARMAELFPCVLDTKYLASRRDLFPPDRFPANYLGGLFDQYGLRSRHVQVTLPVGFEAYDPITLLGRSKGGRGGDPAHEAGFDALMTGTLVLNLLAEVGRDVASAGELANKVAVFRSLYAVDLADPSGDEYLPSGSGSGGAPMVALDLQHDTTVKPAQLESCLAASGVPGAALHAVDEHRTVAVGTATQPAVDPAAIAEALSLRFASFLKAAPLVAPHVARAAQVSTGARFAFPGGGSAGALGKTALRSALRRK